jgi:hypothetical protein
LITCRWIPRHFGAKKLSDARKTVFPLRKQRWTNILAPLTWRNYTVKRRAFISTLATIVAAPVLPSAATMMAPTSTVAQHFARAKMLVECHDRASPEMLARLMRLDVKTAKDLFHLLKERSVISTGIDGLVRAVKPLNAHCITNEAVHAHNLAQAGGGIPNRLKHGAKRKLDDMSQTISTNATPAGSPKGSTTANDLHDTAESNSQT